MHIAYLVSRYPELSETFIAREMQQVVNAGHQLTIAQLRWRRPWSHSQGLRVSGAQVLASQFRPWSWAHGFGWAARKRPAALKQIWHEFLVTFGQCEWRNRLKLVSILLTTLRLAQCLEGRGIEHLRNRFLFGPAISTMWLARLLDIPYSLTVSTGWTPFPRYINEKVVCAASFCVVPTMEAWDLVVDLRGSDEGVHLVRTGVDLRDLVQRAEPPDSAAPPLILAVGRLMRQKGFDVLVRACALLRSRGIAFRCSIVGGGPEHGVLHQLIVEQGLEDMVSLAGALPFEALKPFFREASVVAMPSRITAQGRDGLPNVVVEALAMGVPVVASAVAAIPDLIVDGQTGLLVTPDEPQQLADALETMLADRALRQRLTDAGCAKVRREFDIVATVGQIEGLIQATASASVPTGGLF